jgi:hypothetical protein
MSKSDFALWLGIYASFVASLTGLWTLLRELWLERARLDVIADERWLVRTQGGGHLVVRGDETLRTLGVPSGAKSPILQLTIRNRGRRDARIQSINQATRSGSVVFSDLLTETPFELPAERTRTVQIGTKGGYAHGEIPPRRFYVVDGVNRTHPLRERYRQRLERLFRRRVSEQEDTD